MMFVNKKIFDRLDDATKSVILTAAANAEKKGWALGRKLAVEHTSMLKENGMIVSPPTQQLDAELRGIGGTMVDEWLTEAGDRGKSIVDNYRAM
jgi:TRAP-type C4-dicarboxylate transport system substrate-binding protein